MNPSAVAKGGSLLDGSLSEEAIASSDDVLGKVDRFGNTKGLQQFFTPRNVSHFIAKVMNPSELTLDPTAGSGLLLAGINKAHRFGVELDRDVCAQEESFRAVRGDFQEVAPLLSSMEVQFKQVVSNPPFDITWTVESLNDGRPTTSTVVAFQLLHRLMAAHGHGAFICARSAWDEKVSKLPEAEGAYYVLDVREMWPGLVDVKTVIAFFLKDSIQKDRYGRELHEPRHVMRQEVGLADLSADNVALFSNIRTIRQSIDVRSDWPSNLSPEWMAERFSAAQSEYDRRTAIRLGKRRAQSNFDFSLRKGKVAFTPSKYAELVLARHSMLDRARSYASKPLQWFALNRRDWEWVLQLEAEGNAKISPELVNAVEKCLTEAEMLAVPMYEVKPQMRLGFLQDIDNIECIKSDEAKSIVAGRTYPITTMPVERVEVDHNREVTNRKTGETRPADFKVRRKYLRIRIANPDGYDVVLEESKDDIEYLLEHFNVPNPGTLADRYPVEVATMEKVLLAIRDRQAGRFPLTSKARGWVKGEPHAWDFKPFQVMDLSRILVKRRALLAWEQGLGKTLAGASFIEANFALGRCDKRALIVCPADLIDNWMNEYQLFYGRKPERIRNARQARRVVEHLDAGGEGVYITHYECLSQTDKRNPRMRPDWIGPEREDGTMLPLTRQFAEVIPEHTETVYPDDGPPEEVTIPRTLNRVHRSIATHCPECGADEGDGYHPPTGARHAWCENRPPLRDKAGAPLVDAKGKTRYGRRCTFVGFGDGSGSLKGRHPSVASILSVAFRHGVLVIDELTKIKGSDSDVSKAVRGINAQEVLGLTGTPIKNYVYDAFWGLWKCLGNKTAQFPYGYEDETTFADDFCVVEWEIKPDGKLGTRKAKADVTNLAKLWRLLTPSIIRRRKEETGETLVPRTFYPVTVPMGVAQAQQTAKWLDKFHVFFENENPDHELVATGAHVMLAPMLGMQPKLNYAATMPEADPHGFYWGVEGISNWTPKSAKVLEIAMHHAARGDKVLIGSDLVAPTLWLQQQLAARGVKAEHLLHDDEDGPKRSKNPQQRSQIVKDFQNGDTQVMCATVQAMAYGHNLDQGSVVILDGIPWDYASFDQFLARVHRLTSKRDVSVYVVLAEGSIDEKKWELMVSKGDAANLALDGRLIEHQEAEISKEQIIREFIEQGVKMDGSHVPEGEIEKRWEGIESASDLGEFIRPKPQEGLLDKKAAATDATTFRLVSDSYEVAELDLEDTTDGVYDEGADSEPEAVEVPAAAESVDEEAPVAEGAPEPTYTVTKAFIIPTRDGYVAVPQEEETRTLDGELVEEEPEPVDDLDGFDTHYHDTDAADGVGEERELVLVGAPAEADEPDEPTQLSFYEFDF